MDDGRLIEEVETTCYKDPRKKEKAWDAVATAIDFSDSLTFPLVPFDILLQSEMSQQLFDGFL